MKAGHCAENSTDMTGQGTSLGRSGRGLVLWAGPPPEADGGMEQETRPLGPGSSDVSSVERNQGWGVDTLSARSKLLCCSQWTRSVSERRPRGEEGEWAGLSPGCVTGLLGELRHFPPPPQALPAHLSLGRWVIVRHRHHPGNAASPRGGRPSGFLQRTPRASPAACPVGSQVLGEAEGPCPTGGAARSEGTELVGRAQAPWWEWGGCPGG